MKSPPLDSRYPLGATLIEAIIAIGVLAVAIPLVFGTMAEAGKSGVSAEAETRSTWMVPVCIEEIHASRDGRPQYFSATSPGQAIPPTDELWALGFSEDGKPAGKLTSSQYEQGTREIQGKTLRYVARITAKLPPATDASRLLKVLITIEYPAIAPAAKRRTLDFHTRIP
jgi:type II secretory pathway pseudopilin PulG